MVANQRYLQIAVETASPEQLITMLFDGALRFLRQAEAHLTQGEIEGVHTNLLRTQAIIEELNTSLNMAQGGAVAGNLRSLYFFINERLVAANIHKSAAAIAEAQKLLEELRSMWVLAVRRASKTSVPRPAPTLKPLAPRIDYAVE